MNIRTLLILAFGAAITTSSIAAPTTPATVVQARNTWTLKNGALEVKLVFHNGAFAMTRLANVAAKRDYLAGRTPLPLFSHTVAGEACAADDGQWTLAESKVLPITLYGKTWGQQLEITLTHSLPSPSPSRGEGGGEGVATFSVRQVFELYDGGALRCLSFIKNGTDKPLTISASDVLALNLPDTPHQLHYVTGNLKWNVGTGGLQRGGRNVITRYDSGDGWFVLPENNWATCLVPGASKGDPSNKLLYIYAWDNEPKVRVATNPKAVQLTLFPHEEVEYFSINLGVFKGDAMDGRLAVAEHLRLRFKYHNPAFVFSTNDWQWGNGWGRRTDKNYRDIVVPKAQAAGFDRALIDDGWYAPDDSTTPKPGIPDIGSLARYMADHGLKTGYWFSLQGRFCSRGWAAGRDCADPANVDFKLRQMEEDLIAKGLCSWDQVDAGLLWKTDEETPYSHPMDSVYRKILGAKRYMNTIAHKYPDFIMQTTCELDNPGGAATHGEGAQNVGLIQLPDNGIMGMFRRSEYADDVRDLFAAVGLFPLEGMLSTHGEDGIRADSWVDSPMWYYQFLMARHTMVYSWPGDWSNESVAHMRVFNNWRKNLRFQSLLSEVMRPVYNGPDAVKNEGPWCWMFTDSANKQALVFAINHRDLNKAQTFDAKLRWLNADKTYLIEEITQLPDASFNYNYRGEFTGTYLKEKGLPIDLDAGEERCAAFFVQQQAPDGSRGRSPSQSVKTNVRFGRASVPASRRPQVLYADAAVAKYTEELTGDTLTVRLEGMPNAKTMLIVCKSGKNGVEERQVTLDGSGRADAVFDSTTVTQMAGSKSAAVITTTKGTRDTATAGSWCGKYGGLAAWIAGNNIAATNGFSLSAAVPVYVWNKGDANAVPRVLAPPIGTHSPKKAACWTTGEKFAMLINAPAARHYKLSVYVMDYDNGQRGMEITVKSRDRKVYDRQNATVAETNQGIYLCWDVTGPVTITARKTEGFNAVVSGVFVDETTKQDR